MTAYEVGAGRVDVAAAVAPPSRDRFGVLRLLRLAAQRRRRPSPDAHLHQHRRRRRHAGAAVRLRSPAAPTTSIRPPTPVSPPPTACSASPQTGDRSRARHRHRHRHREADLARDGRRYLGQIVATGGVMSARTQVGLYPGGGHYSLTSATRTRRQARFRDVAAALRAPTPTRSSTCTTGDRTYGYGRHLQRPDPIPSGRQPWPRSARHGTARRPGDRPRPRPHRHPRRQQAREVTAELPAAAHRGPDALLNWYRSDGGISTV